MTIVSFYSFKGGVGRTFTALEAAAQLARSGRSVCVWDLDLEAPALHRHAQLVGVTGRMRSGTLDLLETAAADGSVSPDAVDAAVVTLRAKDYSLSFLMAAGADSLTADETSEVRSYAERYWAIDWAADYRSNRAQNSFLSIADRLAEQFDVVVIDARTGLTDLGYLSSRLLADAVVIVFGMSDQNVEGLRTAHQAITRTVGSEPAPWNLLVANLVPDSLARASNPRIASAYETQRQRLADHGLAADIELPLVPARLIDDLVPSLEGGLIEEATPFRPVVRWIEELLPTISIESGSGLRILRPHLFEQDVLGLLSLLGWRILAPAPPQSDHGFDAVMQPPATALVGRPTLVSCRSGPVDLESVRRLGDVLREVEDRRSERLEALLVTREHPSQTLVKEGRRRGIALVSAHELVGQLFNPTPMLRALEKEPPTTGALRFAERQAFEIDGVPGSLWLIEELSDRALTADPGLTLVVGPPGSGKSTVLRQLAVRLGSMWRTAADLDHAIIPVLVPAAELRSDVPEAIEETVARVAASHGVAATLDVIQHLRRTGRLVVLIDGLDEIGPDALDALRLGPAVADGPIIATSRSAHMMQLAGLAPMATIIIKGIDPSEVDRALERAFGREVNRVRSRIAEEPALAALMSLPLGLQLVMDHADFSREDVTLSSLIEQATRAWLEREGAAARVKSVGLLEQIAVALHGNGGNQFDLEMLETMWCRLTDLEPELMHSSLVTCPFLRRIGQQSYAFTDPVIAEWFLGSALAKVAPSVLGGAIDLPRMPAFATSVWAELVQRGPLRDVVAALVDFHGQDPMGVPERVRINSFLMLRALGATAAAPALELDGADLSSLDLSDSDLASAHLVGADLRLASLTGSDLRSAHLDHARLDHANLQAANLTRASLAEARLFGARLVDAVLHGAVLAGAHLEGADLRSADLTDVDLRGAFLSNADLRDADLAGARIQRASVRGVIVSPDTLKTARFSE